MLRGRVVAWSCVAFGRVAVLSFGLMCQASSGRMAQNIQATSGRGCRNGYLEEQRAGFYDGPSTCAIPARRRAKLDHGLRTVEELASVISS